MRSVIRGFTRSLPGAAAMLALVACGSTPAPTTGDGESAPATGASSASLTIRGSVLDAAKRPLANAQVKCASAQCSLFRGISAEHHSWVEGAATNASGSYEMRVRASDATFLVSASARGYETQLREARLPDAECRWNLPGCTVTLSFALTGVAD